MMGQDDRVVESVKGEAPQLVEKPGRSCLSVTDARERSAYGWTQDAQAVDTVPILESGYSV